MSKSWALVTGASSGIGEEIARRLSRRGHPVVLVARRRDRLEKLAAELESESRIVCADLSAPEGVASTLAAVEGLELGILVNNAGFGAFRAFSETPLERASEMVRLNVLALAELTRGVLPGMLARGNGRIVNVASTAGFFHLPGFALYGATKHFVVSFSLALAAEVRDRGVSVTCVCPGPVDTEFGEVAGFRMRTHRLVTLTADECAAFSLRAMDAGQALAVPHLLMKAAAVLSRVLPRALSPRILVGLMRLIGVARVAGLHRAGRA